MPLFFKSIKSKIFLGYAAILCVTLITSGLLASSNKNIKNNVSEFIENTLPTLDAISKLQHMAKEQVLAGYSLYGTTLDINDFNLLKQQLEQQLQIEQTKLADIQNKQLIEEFAGLHQALISLADVMGDQSVDWDLARENLNSLSMAAKQLNDSLDLLAIEVSENAKSRSRNIEASLENNTLLIFLLVFVMVFVAIAAYIVAQKQIAKPIQLLATKLIDISRMRDLTQILPDENVTEINTVATSVNGLVSMFNGGMLDMRNVVQHIDAAVIQLSKSTSSSNQAVTNLSDGIESLIHIMDDLETYMQQSLNHSESAAHFAEQGAENMAEGQIQVRLASESINALSNDIETTSSILVSLQSSGSQVSNVVETIANIASQTNLLALNAAIEAARAGESGRGFAVVADEVRTLAIRTAQSTNEINALLEGIVGSIKDAVDNMNNNREKAQQSVVLTNTLVTSLGNGRQVILSLADTSKEASQQVSLSQHHTSKAKDFVHGFQTLGQTVQSSAEQTQSTSEDLISLAKEISTNLSKYKIIDVHKKAL